MRRREFITLIGGLRRGRSRRAQSRASGCGASGRGLDFELSRLDPGGPQREDSAVSATCGPECV